MTDHSSARSTRRSAGAPVCLSLIGALALAPAALFCSLSAATAAADDKKLPEKWDRWLNKEVVYIISDREREIFRQLESEEQRERFERKFWEVRDPTPGTDKNEYREEHQRRVDYANKFYRRGSVLEGWQTDRGRTYITLGKPQEVQSYPGGGAVFPMELWFYQGDQSRGLPPFFYLIFFQRQGAGEYRLYNPITDGPQSLVTSMPGSTREAFQYIYENVNPEVAMASINYMAADGVYDPDRPSLSSAMVLAKIEAVRNKAAKADWAELILLGKEEVTTEYAFSSARLPSVFFPFVGEAGGGFIDFAFLLTPDQIKLGRHEDLIYGAYEIGIRLADSEGIIIFSDTRSFELNLNEEEFERIRQRPILYEDKLPCIPGRFNLSIQVRNKVTKEFQVTSATVEVPEFPADSPGAGPLVVTSDFKILEKSEQQRITPFQYSMARLTAAPMHSFTLGKPLVIYCRLYLPPERRFEGKEEFGLKYSLVAENGEEKLTHTRVLSKDQFSAEGINHLFTQIPTDKLTPGRYTVVLEVDFRRPGEKLSRTVEFEIGPGPEAEPLIEGCEAIDPESAASHLARGRMWEKSGDREKALQSYLAAVASETGCSECRLTLAGLLIELRREEEALRVLEPVAIAEPTNPRMLYATARAYFGSEQYSKAVKYLERLQYQEGDSTSLLNFLGEALWRNGEVERAVAVWRRSLELDPNQPDIREKLNENAEIK